MSPNKITGENARSRRPSRMSGTSLFAYRTFRRVGAAAAILLMVALFLAQALAPRCSTVTLLAVNPSTNAVLEASFQQRALAPMRHVRVKRAGAGLIQLETVAATFPESRRGAGQALEKFRASVLKAYGARTEVMAVLDRPRAQIDYYRRGSQAMVYGAGPEGMKLLEERLGIPHRKVDWTARNRHRVAQATRHFRLVQSRQGCRSMRGSAPWRGDSEPEGVRGEYRSAGSAWPVAFQCGQGRPRTLPRSRPRQCADGWNSGAGATAPQRQEFAGCRNGHVERLAEFSAGRRCRVSINTPACSRPSALPSPKTSSNALMVSVAERRS